MIMLIPILVVIVSACLFVAWVVMTILNVIRRVIGFIARPAPSIVDGRSCMVNGCRANNPMHARFCRRCGSSLQAAGYVQRSTRPQTFRAAMRV